jgi:hypothetical membrane protein
MPTAAQHEAVAAHDVPMANVLAALLFLGSLVAALLGVGIAGVSRSAVHEIEALLCFLIAVCGFGFTAIVAALGRSHAIETELRALHRLAAEAGQREVYKMTQMQQPR